MSLENITFYPAKKATLNITQLEPLALYACGHPVKVISYKLGKADPTINNHLISARHHYRANNTTHAACIAIACGDIKFKLTNARSVTLRISAMAFGLLAAIVSVQDTPFVTDIDHSVIRHTRTVRGHKHGRNNKRNDALDQLFA